MTTAILVWLGVLAYLAGTGLLLRKLQTKNASSAAPKLGYAIVPWVLHALVIARLGLNDGQLDVSFYDALSIVGWCIVGLVLLGSIIQPISMLLLVVLPVAATILGLQWLFGRDHQRLVDYGWQIDVHIALGVLAFALLSIAAAQAVLLALQERALRQPSFTGWFSALPPLPTMERMLFQLIGLGFGLLTLTLLSGLVFVDDLMAQHLAHKTVLSLVGWLVFGALLLGRWRFGWRGKTAIRLTLAGMGVLLLAYFGSKLVLELILQRS